MKLSKALGIVGLALTIATTGAMAQNGGGNQGGNQGGNRRQGGGGGGGGFDFAEMQQRRMERIRETMGVSDDAEWKVIQERAQKVMDAQMAVGAMRVGRGGRGGGPGGGFGGGPGGRGNFQASPEAEALRNAIENNAPAEQIKAALQKYRDARKTREAALEKAQADLKQILSVKQEAVAVTQGLLD